MQLSGREKTCAHQLRASPPLQHHHLLVHGIVEQAGVSLLKIRAPAPANEEGVSSEAHDAVIENLGAVREWEGHGASSKSHVGHTSISVARSGPDLELMSAELDDVAVLNVLVGLCS